MKSKWQSRKFWICVAAGLTAFGTNISGVISGNEILTIVGSVCLVLSATIYAVCEAWVDASNKK